MPMPLRDLAGQTFGRWTVVERVADRRPGVPSWLCWCECGEERPVEGVHLRRGSSQSCGCKQADEARVRASVNSYRHGQCETPAYIAWAAMIQRCENPKCRGYKNYGGRGIRVCQEWHKFEPFFTHMGPRPSGSHSIERIDVDGNYDPGNVRWALYREQQRNKRTNHRLTHDGVTQSIADWAEQRGIPYFRLLHRVRSGMPSSLALSTEKLQSGHRGGGMPGQAAPVRA